MGNLRVASSRLAEQGLSLAVAETSCGGRISSAIVSRPGASAVFRGAIVAYHDDVKRGLLRVPPETIAADGVVSEAVAVAMARGVRRQFGADLGLAETGIAGPQEGRRSTKPVGMAFLAVATATDSWPLAVQVAPGSRRVVQRRIRDRALSWLAQCLAGSAARDGTSDHQ